MELGEIQHDPFCKWQWERCICVIFFPIQRFSR